MSIAGWIIGLALACACRAPPPVSPRLDLLGIEHRVLGAQPLAINALAASASLADDARDAIHEKLQIFQLRVDAAGDRLAALRLARGAARTVREHEVARALQHAAAARDDAWHALRAVIASRRWPSLSSTTRR